MPKLIGLFRRKKGFSAGQFRDYYENYHAPFAASHFGHLFAGYTRNYVEHSVRGEHDVDVLTEIVFPDHEAMAAMFAMTRHDPALGRAIAADEATFMDRDATQLLIITDDRTIASDRA